MAVAMRVDKTNSTKDERERILRAAEAFEPMVNGLLAPFIRMVTRKPDLRVEIHATGSSTNGRVVYLRLPVNLGDKVEHNHRLCDERDPETLMMLCPACLVYDEALCVSLHESWHIVYGTFGPVTDKDRKLAMDGIAQDHIRGAEDPIKAEAMFRKRLGQVMVEIEKGGKETASYMPIASAIDPWLPMVVNVIEDVYVNACGMKDRPGTRVQFSASWGKTFRDGVETAGIGKWAWADADADAQAVIACYLIGSSLDHLGKHLSPVIMDEVMTDPEIRRISHSIIGLTTARSRFTTAMELLRALRALGYCQVTTLPEDEEPGRGKGEAGGGEGEEGEPGDPGDDDEAGEPGEPKKGTTPGKPGDGPPPPDTEESDEDTPGGKPQIGDTEAEDTRPEAGPPKPEKPEASGDPTKVEKLVMIAGEHDPDEPKLTEKEEEVIDALIHQREHFDEPSLTMVGLKVIPSKKMPEGPLPVINPALLNPNVNVLRTALSENSKSHIQGNLKSGPRLHTPMLGLRIATDDPRLYARKTIPKKRNYFAAVGLDLSGSTGGGVLTLIKQGGLMSAEMFQALGIKFALYGHSGSDSYDVDHYEVKAPHEPWNDLARKRLAGLTSHRANLDGHSLEFYRKLAQRQQATDKLIVYFTDGGMPAENPAEELRILRREIKTCKRLGIALVFVGVQNDEPRRKFDLPMVRLDRMQDMPKVIKFIGEAVDKVRI